MSGVPKVLKGKLFRMGVVAVMMITCCFVWQDCSAPTKFSSSADGHSENAPSTGGTGVDGITASNTFGNSKASLVAAQYGLAESDGFVMVSASPSGNSDQCWLSVVSGEPGGNFHLVAADVATSDQSGDQVSAANVNVPITHGTFFQFSTSNPCVINSAQWVPLPVGSFAAVQAIALGTSIQATSDGFLQISAAPVGAGNHCTVSVSSGGGPIASGIGASDATGDTQSEVNLLVPIPNGSSFNVQTQNGCQVNALRWVPLNSGHFGSPQNISVGQILNASTPGLLVLSNSPTGSFDQCFTQVYADTNATPTTIVTLGEGSTDINGVPISETQLTSFISQGDFLTVKTQNACQTQWLYWLPLNP
jgi:hypothetical protein